MRDLHDSKCDRLRCDIGLTYRVLNFFSAALIVSLSRNNLGLTHPSNTFVGCLRELLAEKGESCPVACFEAREAVCCQLLGLLYVLSFGLRPKCVVLPIEFVKHPCLRHCLRGLNRDGVWDHLREPRCQLGHGTDELQSQVLLKALLPPLVNCKGMVAGWDTGVLDLEKACQPVGGFC